MAEHEISIRQAQPMETYSDDAFNRIIEAVTRGDMPVETVERLVALSEKMMEQRRRQAYAEAMARLQAKLPQISKEGRIDVSGQTRSRYSRLEDIDIAIKPLLAEEGFSFSFNEESAEGQVRRFSGKLSHKDGHFETKFITLPLDTSGSKNSVQSAGSTTTYAIRYLIKMHLNIVEKGEDTDANSLEPITDEQVKDLISLATEVKANKDALFQILGVQKWEDILSRDYDKAVRALEMKRRLVK